MATKKVRKRKRKSHYHTGDHVSSKLLNGPAHYRSGWEEKYMLWLDNNEDVVSYEYESIVIAYLANIKLNKVKKYFVDIFVHYLDGRNELIEIKPHRKLKNVTVIKKQLAAENWCKDNNATYKLITEVDLKELEIL